MRNIVAMLQVTGDEIDTAYVNEWARHLGFTEARQIVLNRVRGQ